MKHSFRKLTLRNISCVHNRARLQCPLPAKTIKISSISRTRTVYLVISKDCVLDFCNLVVIPIAPPTPALPLELDSAPRGKVYPEQYVDKGD